MATKSARKLEQRMVMSLERRVAPWRLQLPNWNQMLWACVFCQQVKVQQVKKGAEDLLKNWVGVQRGQSWEVSPLAFVGHPSWDGITIKIPYGVDVLLHQPASQSFPSRLVKTKSDFIVRLVETGLERWMLVVAVISVDAYPFLAFLGLTCYLEDTGIGVFWLQCATW